MGSGSIASPFLTSAPDRNIAQFRYCPGICIEVLRKTTGNLSQSEGVAQLRFKLDTPSNIRPEKCFSIGGACILIGMQEKFWVCPAEIAEFLF
jgi:hypothetical protein